MPNRIIKESICVSGSVDRLSWFEEVLFYRLIVSCDDYGRFDGRVAVVKNRLFPLKNRLTARAVEEGLKKLEAAGLVRCYEAEGKPYLFLPGWNDHQNVRAKRSKYPAPDNICIQENTDAPDIRIQSVSVSESGSEAEEARVRFSPPSPEEVTAYCMERGKGVDGARFHDYYTANGWMVGKNKMKDWKAAVRSWEQKEKSFRHSGGANPFLQMLEEGSYE